MCFIWLTEFVLTQDAARYPGLVSHSFFLPSLPMSHSLSILSHSFFFPSLYCHLFPESIFLFNNYLLHKVYNYILLLHNITSYGIHNIYYLSSLSITNFSLPLPSSLCLSPSGFIPFFLFTYHNLSFVIYFYFLLPYYLSDQCIVIQLLYFYQYSRIFLIRTSKSFLFKTFL